MISLRFLSNNFEDIPMTKRLPLILTLFLAFAMPVHADDLDDANWTVFNRTGEGGQYWQRVSTASAIYTRGPKAQQILNRDIARCVVELRELERLGAVKDAIPEYAEGLVLSEAEAELAKWDTPERDEHLFAEHSDYHDFEGCMLAKGWERIKYVPFDVAKEAQKNYLRSSVRYKTRYPENKPGYNANFDQLND